MSHRRVDGWKGWSFRPFQMAIFPQRWWHCNKSTGCSPTNIPGQNVKIFKQHQVLKRWPNLLSNTARTTRCENPGVLCSFINSASEFHRSIKTEKIAASWETNHASINKHVDSALVWIQYNVCGWYSNWKRNCDNGNRGKVFGREQITISFEMQRTL